MILQNIKLFFPIHSKTKLISDSNSDFDKSIDITKVLNLHGCTKVCEICLNTKRGLESLKAANSKGQTGQRTYLFSWASTARCAKASRLLRATTVLLCVDEDDDDTEVAEAAVGAVW